MTTPLLPDWLDRLRNLAPALLGAGGLYAAATVAFGFSPETTDVGYAPEQPIPFSHRLHAGELRIDCRYCHDTVERAAHAAIPPTATCMNCHARVRTESRHLALLRRNHAAGQPIPWIRVHDLPDHAYFDHSAHVGAGVGCVSCHGRVDRMDVVEQVEPLSMGWCLDCHRDPAPHLRPPERVTDMGWQPAEHGGRGTQDQLRHGRSARGAAQDCSACHR
ncbi:MAG: cytochrome c3 family protein [Planctomycetota bacterium]